MINIQNKQYTVDETQIKVIIKEKEDWGYTNLDQLRNNPGKSKRLLEISMEKGLSNSLAALPMYDFGFELSKQHFRDTIHLWCT